MNRIIILAILSIVLLAAISSALPNPSPAGAADATPDTARSGWAVLEVARPAGADDAVWARTLMTEAEKLRQTQIVEGSGLFQNLQKLFPGTSAAELNARFVRGLEVNVIGGTALIRVRVSMGDDAALSAKATAELVHHYELFGTMSLDRQGLILQSLLADAQAKLAASRSKLEEFLNAHAGELKLIDAFHRQELETEYARQLQETVTLKTHLAELSLQMNIGGSPVHVVALPSRK